MKIRLWWKKIGDGEVTVQEVHVPGTIAESGKLADAYIRGSKRSTRARLVMWDKVEDDSILPTL